MPRGRELEAIRRLLIQKRHRLLSSQKAASVEADELTQLRESEYEETAQVELAQFTLSHLVEAQRKEVEQIDAALQRLEAGVFGICIDCGANIPKERLMALPMALRCEEDASQRERESRGSNPSPTL